MLSNVDLDSFICVPISSELYQAVASRYPKGVSEIIDYAVLDFLDRTELDWKDVQSGIKWGRLFLPEGTLLRTKYRGEYIEAKVGDEVILWNDDEYSSVASVTNSMRNNTSNNAWKVIEIKRPSDSRWQIADNFR